MEEKQNNCVSKNENALEESNVEIDEIKCEQCDNQVDENATPCECCDEKSPKKRRAVSNRTLKITVMAMLCALTAVVTWILPIPMPATEGYVNFGDTVIFISASFMGGIPGMVVGGIGSMLADLFGGYMHWAGFTLLIKGIEGLICGLIYRGLSKKINSKVSLFIAMLIAGIWMVLGYYFAGAIMYGWAGSWASVPGNCIQAGVSIAVGYALAIIFNQIKPLRPFLDRIK